MEEVVMFAKDPASQFTDLLIQITESTMPLSSKKLPKIPWFDDNCQIAIKERKKESIKIFFSTNHINQSSEL